MATDEVFEPITKGDEAFIWFWRVLMVVGLSVEAERLLRKKDGGTYSRFTALTFHTDTKMGRAVWRIVWGGFSSWYLVHVDNWFRYHHSE